MRTIDYYVTIASPWAYLGHELFLATAARHGAGVNYKPMPILDVFEATGSLPLPKRPPARQRYRFVEMQRWREKRGLPLNLKPAFAPFDAALVNKAIIAIAAAGRDPGAFALSAFRGSWVEEKNLADPAVVAAALTAAGFDAEAILASATSAETAETFAANGRDAIAADVFGAPGYVLDGEVFWGQDRIELLADALASGRTAYRPV